MLQPLHTTVRRWGRHEDRTCAIHSSLPWPVTPIDCRYNVAAALAPSGLGTFETFPKKRIELALYQLASSWPVHPGSSNVAQGSRCEALDQGGRSPVSQRLVLQVCVGDHPLVCTTQRIANVLHQKAVPMHAPLIATVQAKPAAQNGGGGDAVSLAP